MDSATQHFSQVASRVRVDVDEAQCNLGTMAKVTDWEWVRTGYQGISGSKALFILVCCYFLVGCGLKKLSGCFSKYLRDRIPRASFKSIELLMTRVYGRLGEGVLEEISSILKSFLLNGDFTQRNNYTPK